MNVQAFLIKQLFFLILISSLHGYELYSSSEIEPTLQLLKTLPAAEKLINEVLSEGDISIIFCKKNTAGFQAMWDGTLRTIFLNPDDKHSSELISSLLFELHNAKNTSKLGYIAYLARTKQLDEKTYVSQIEALEFQSAHSTSRMLLEGIRRGLFPKEAFWSVPEDFSTYLHLQRATGHSAWIAYTFRNLNVAR